MEETQKEPLILCLKNSNGEVPVEIEAGDNFQMFLDKAKALLGFEINLNSITNNQPVSLTDNIYQFLINAEQNLNDVSIVETFDQMDTNTNDADDLVYVLDDGTQIKASQIQFDNEDPPVDLTAEEIPFVRYAEDSADESENSNAQVVTTKRIDIVESPVAKWSRNPSPKCSFVNSLPFRLVCNNTSNFEAQFTKYLESNSKNHSNLNLAKEMSRNRNDDFTLTREDILNMFKDAPVTSTPCEEKRKHSRKSDPTRLVHKTWNTKPLSCVVDSHGQICFICKKFVDSSIEKLYLFDNEDQKIHRCSPQRRLSTQLKILCEQCLDKNFKASEMKSPTQSLKPDEYLIIKNNQQYIFQKTTSINLKECDEDFRSADETNDDKAEINEFIDLSHKQSVDFVKVEIGSDGEIVTKSLYDEPGSDDVIVVQSNDKSSSDVEILEPDVLDSKVVENLDEPDEDLGEFLGKYQCDEDAELKCRFCEKIFESCSEVMDHGAEHKHDLEEGAVFPCPLCDYGYTNLKWLKGHIKAAHDKPKREDIDDKKDVDEVTNQSPVHSPVARRTRSAIKKTDCQTEKENPEAVLKDEIKLETTDTTPSHLEIKMEVKQEVLDSSDDEIWILQTGDEDTSQLEELLQGVKVKSEDGPSVPKVHSCANCNQSFTSTAALLEHKCARRRGRKRKPKDAACAQKKENPVKRSKGRPRQYKIENHNDLLVERPRKKRNRQPTSDPQIVTCHNCNESFTSKVRLKFHMQFHETNSFLTPSGEYTCPECGDARFPTESELFDHVHFQHDKQRRWHCPVDGCGKTFFLKATLTKHSRTHTDTRRYVCVTCGKRFLDKQTLDEHGVTHLQIKPFQCHICLKQLTRRSRLRMHLRAHEEELRPKLVLVCAVCSRAFRDREEAQEHASKSTECIAAVASELKEETDSVTQQLSPSSGEIRHTVKVVESPINKPIMGEVNDSESRELLAELEDSASLIVRVVRIEKAFRCEYCEDVFYQEDALNAHRSIHKGVKNPFICHICKVSFATYSRCTTHKTTHGFYKRSLADAKKQEHSQEPEAGPSATGILGYGGFPVVKHFLCENCGRSYLHWTYLQVHRRMKHANENFIFKCNQCDITFPNSWSVAYHRKKVHGKTNQEEGGGVTKIAREDYRIPCRDCDDILPNKTALYKHRQKEHSDGSLCVNTNEDSSTNSSRTACSKCGHSFQHPQDLQKHLDSVHGHEVRRNSAGKTYACPLCERSFRAASSRDEHLRVHTGERPYPCDVCGVAFRRSTAMRNHRLIHTGVRAWACQHCPKRFRIRSDLRTHLRLKHPAHLVVIEVQGLNPSNENILNQLKMNNISQEKILEITLMSFEKGTSSVIPNSSRALSTLGSVPRTQISLWSPNETPAQHPSASPIATGTYSLEDLPVRRGRGIAKEVRRPQIFDAQIPQDQNSFPVTVSVSEESLSGLNVQLMVDAPEEPPLQLDAMLLQ